MDAFGRKIVKFGLKFLKDPLEFSILFIAEKTERRTAPGQMKMYRMTKRI